MTFDLFTLEALIEQRTLETPEKSYTALLLSKGIEHCSKKFGEEAFELALSMLGNSNEHTKAEAADVIYHLLILLKAKGISLAEVMNVLESRTQQSGLQEKASRA